SEPGFSRKVWAQFAELGWLGMAFPESAGGFGGSAVEVAVLMEAIGKGIVVEPFLSTVVLGGGALLAGGGRHEVLEGVIAGTTLLALAYAEPKSRYNLADVSTKAARQGAGFVLDGHKSVVLHGGSADRLVVSARTGGGQRDEDGITLFLVDANAKGVSRRDYRTVDGHRAAEIKFEHVAVGADAAVGPVDGGFALLDRTIERGMAAVAAEAVGLMQVMTKMTQEYLKTRVQFGAPIGVNQVLQHRLVEMFMAQELSQSMAYMAAIKLDDEDSIERTKAVTAAKAQIGQAGRKLGQEAIQMHGGIGMTDELALGHYFKRLTMIDTMFGNADYHLRRFADLAASARAA
ncbi:MAG: acyl-CoA dehydrogenase family protein, partial [Alphaproteobacteria bacterium]